MSILALLLAVSIVPPGEAFTCTPVAVWDGDGPMGGSGDRLSFHNEKEPRQSNTAQEVD